MRDLNEDHITINLKFQSISNTITQSSGNSLARQLAGLGAKRVIPTAFINARNIINFLKNNGFNLDSFFSNSIWIPCKFIGRL